MWTTPGTRQALRENTSALPGAPVVPDPGPPRWRPLLAALLRRLGLVSVALAGRLDPGPAPRLPAPQQACR